MSERIREMIQEIEVMKQKLKEEIAKEEDHINYEIKSGYVIFDEEVIRKQKENMKKLMTYLREIPILNYLSAPLIYGMVIPAFLLDMMLFLYQQVVFRIYKFEFVKRSDYIVFDRQYLEYLNPIEKLNCMYCSYFNGLMQYAACIAARTEFYFCPIKHAKKVAYEHDYYNEFFAYGDEQEYQNRLEALREEKRSS